MIYTLGLPNGVILKSDTNGFFKLQDPGLVACGRCGAGVMTMLRTRHRQTCKMEEEPLLGPGQEVAPDAPQEPNPGDPAPEPPEAPRILIPQLVPPSLRKR